MSVPIPIDESDTISGKISEDNKLRMKVILIAFMLIFTMIATGCLTGEDTISVDVDEGFDEMTLEYLPGPDEVTTYPNVSATATTHINNDSYMKFDVIPRSIMVTERSQIINLNLSAETILAEDLKPTSFKFTFRLIEAEEFADNFMHFQKERTETDNNTFVFEERISRYSHALHFDVNSYVFHTETLLQWDIWNTSWGYPATLEVTASLDGFAEEVVATIYVHIRGDEI